MKININKKHYITIIIVIFLCLIVLSVQAKQSDTKFKQAQQLSQEVKSDHIMNDVSWLADDARMGRRAGTPYEDKVADWLISRYEKLGLEQFKKLGLSNFTHDFEFHIYDDAGIEHPAFGKNIIGVIPGATKANEYLMVSAHYDHLGVEGELIYNGADDNATGVAAMLEIARVIKQSNLRPEKTIVFVSFSAEEIGRHGSWNFCNIAHENNIVEDITSFNFEMFGAAKGVPMYVHVWEQQTIATQPIIQAVKMASDAMKIDMITSMEKDPGSDSVELLECGILSTTMDVSGGQMFEYNHPHYHTEQDTVENIDPGNFYKAVQIATMSVWLLAN